MVIFLNTASVT